MPNQPKPAELTKKLLKVKEIKNLPKDFEEGIIYCEVTVKRFMDKSSWYFRKCTGCDLELEVQDAKFKCLRDGGCGRIYPYPEKRFHGCTVYNAKQIVDTHEKGDSFDPNKATVVDVEDVSMQNVTETDATANQTPNTGYSTNMKSRARKITEALEYNQTETATATIPPLKNIKIEKASLIDLQLSSAFLDGIIFYICQLIMQGQRIHAFVPTKCVEEIYSQIIVGRVFSIKQFMVQKYSQTEKFRVVRNESQLIFSKDTIIQEQADDGVTIPQEAFDFYDHSQLIELSNQTTYLAENTSADVVGIKKDYDQIRDLKNKHCQDQKKTKLVITDGRLANEEFAKKALGKNNVKTIHKINVDELKKLGKNAIEGLFMLHVTIKSIDPTFGWFYNACTSCEKETKMENPCPICESCNRYVPYPDQKFRFHVIAEDMTGKVQVVLGHREARTIIRKRCLHLADECLTESHVQMFTEEGLSKTLLSIVDKDYSLVIQVREMNVVNNFNVYRANNICKGFVGLPGATNQSANAKDAQTSQPTTSTYNAGGLSDIDLASN
ncbi:hypothetical protein DCAR_0100983 [Daucus carota subsp. sativus]|uniref:Replication factor A C-terminal domain-containing protein n=1 Tax=Daucus carota subsp. sativus TaxID=79200 RepID=A0AAF0W2F1_DAUCS|nr:hypothetical protein DCAR_0100983 [Daucus carota subsp. sativus]